MFERFTAQAREVVAVSRDYAAKYRHDKIELGDLLMALASVGPSIAATVLGSIVIDERYTLTHSQLDEMVAALPYDVYEGDAPDETRRQSVQIPFDGSTSKVLELGYREALSLGHNSVEPHHLLLGLLRHELPGLEPSLPVGAIRDAVFKKLMEQPSPAKLVQWSPGMTASCQTFLEASEVALDLLDREAIPLFEIRRAIDEVAVSAEAFRDALEAAVLPARPQG